MTCAPAEPASNPVVKRVESEIMVLLIVIETIGLMVVLRFVLSQQEFYQNQPGLTTRMNMRETLISCPKPLMPIQGRLWNKYGRQRQLRKVRPRRPPQNC